MANSPHNQDTITVPQTGTMLVNFRHISDPTIKNPYIDWNKNDALTQTVESLIQQTTADVKDHFAAQERSGTGMDLLATHHWSGAQKVEWEEALAKIVSENVEETPGFSEYREAGFHSGRITLGDGTLNAVSIDLTSSEADTYGQKLNMIQFSDKEMAIVEGVIFNHVQNSLLPKEPQEPGNEKVASNYFLVSGQTLSNEKSQISFLGESLPPAAQRSFIISAHTGNIIEPVGNNMSTMTASYVQDISPEYSFEDFINGKPVIGQNDLTAYALPGQDAAQLDAARQERIVEHINSEMENRLQERYVKPIESCCSPETGLPETVTYEGREMPINQALRNPELFEKLHAMMEGNDEAQQALEDYRMAQSDIQSGRAALYLKDEARDLMEQFGVTERDARTDILDSITQRVEGLEQENEYVDPEIAELERQLEMEAQQVAAPDM